MSNCFSLLTLRREHSNVDLYTDDFGFDILINQLNLPYGDVSLTLNSLKNEDHRLWILGKIKVIELQEKPFVHVDNDVFTWEPFPKSNQNDYLLVQSKHFVPDNYKLALLEVQKKLTNVPLPLNKDINEYNFNVNVGIVGGNDIDFFQNWCNTAKNFLKENKLQITDLENIGYFNQIIEEFFISCLLSERKNVTYLIDCSNDPNVLDSVLQFHLVPFLDRYIHLVGIAKKNELACKQLELRLKHEFPEYHKKVIDLINSFDCKDSSSLYEKMKFERISKSLQIVYSYKYRELKSLKIKLYDNFTIYENEEDGSFCFIEVDPFSGIELHKMSLKGINQLICYFAEPLSLNELIELIKRNLQINNDIEVRQMEKNIVSSIFEEILLVGSLEIGLGN
ncbi:hypothetical protein EGN73_21590 [Arthrospiribacter ruber]|uniref:DUF6734 domain-containing protein n=2 Tax=Arthrospiribacter ruber TaxID=2487934 RepID=A0A951MFP9_9BACT|nr:DUF6734 family protein [Arthrospiribacter ruber]MBW3470379.1 hypothetical protein [Arthrospiribacter ruber]